MTRLERAIEFKRAEKAIDEILRKKKFDVKAYAKSLLALWRTPAAEGETLFARMAREMGSGAQMLLLVAYFVKKFGLLPAEAIVPARQAIECGFTADSLAELAMRAPVFPGVKEPTENDYRMLATVFRLAKEENAAIISDELRVLFT